MEKTLTIEQALDAHTQCCPYKKLRQNGCDVNKDCSEQDCWYRKHFMQYITNKFQSNGQEQENA